MERTPRQQRQLERRLTLHRHRKRTGVCLSDLLAGRDDAPQGFNSQQIERFYRGTSSSALVAHLEYVIALWAALPDRSKGRPKRPPRVRHEKVELTAELRNELLGHWRRTGLPIENVFRRFANPPEGLSARVLYRWLKPKPPLSVRKDHVEFALTAWRAIPSQMLRVKSSVDGLNHDRSIQIAAPVDFTGRPL